MEPPPPVDPVLERHAGRPGTPSTMSSGVLQRNCARMVEGALRPYPARPFRHVPGQRTSRMASQSVTLASHRNAVDGAKKGYPGHSNVVGLKYIRSMFAVVGLPFTSLACCKRGPPRGHDFHPHAVGQTGLEAVVDVCEYSTRHRRTEFVSTTVPRPPKSDSLGRILGSSDEPSRAPVPRSACNRRALLYHRGRTASSSAPSKNREYMR